ncbi:MAG: methyltransferase family protein, partial [Candidatus Dormibacteraceae bacterium]
PGGQRQVGENSITGIRNRGNVHLGAGGACPAGRISAETRAGDWNWVVGGTIFAVGVVFMLPAFAIRPFTGPQAGMSLRTGGFYGIVRNPLYLADVLWCLGWAVMFRSEIGIVLVPVWWAGLWLLTIIEEESLERKLGQTYIEYRRRIRGRILPGLPL